MRAINYMNFVRDYEPRYPDINVGKEILFNTTQDEINLAKKYDIPSTFLLQYDALIDEKYIKLFKANQDEKTELGLWYEINKQLLDEVGLAWRGKQGWTWDWHIIPGFSMAYTRKERELLIDTAMNKFKEIYGFYPKSVASWLIDSYTVEILSEKYNVSYIGICRDQVATDAYTLVGGYFSGGYYPSKNNMFTPAQTKENRLKSPVFRLLGPDPIHNYDSSKYLFECKEKIATLYTLEPAWEIGRQKDVIEWYNKTYFENEDLGFSYAQIGQENSFGTERRDLIDTLEMQINVFLKNYDVKFMTTGQTGEYFKKNFAFTPSTVVFASDDWATGKKTQSLIYDGERFTANLFRYKDKIFIRNIYLFDENKEEDYLFETCKTPDALYENLPICDTLLWKENEGILLDNAECEFKAEKLEDGVIKVYWNDKEIVISKDKIIFKNLTPKLDTTGSTAKIEVEDDKLKYNYKNTNYEIKISNAKPVKDENYITFVNDGEFEMNI